MNIAKRMLVAGVTALSVATAPTVLAQYTADFQTNIISGVTSNWSGDYRVGDANSSDALASIFQKAGPIVNWVGRLPGNSGGRAMRRKALGQYFNTRSELSTGHTLSV